MAKSVRRIKSKRQYIIVARRGNSCAVFAFSENDALSLTQGLICPRNDALRGLEIDTLTQRCVEGVETNSLTQRCIEGLETDSFLLRCIDDSPRGLIRTHIVNIFMQGVDKQML